MTQSLVGHHDSDGMIDETIRVRDRYQFEIKLNYPLSADNKTTTYDLECHIFIPSNLGIHRERYSKKSFYDDLQTHIRLKTPSIPLSDIVGNPDSPGAKLKDSAVRLTDIGDPLTVSQFEHRIKLFCCILNSTLRDSIVTIAQTLDRKDRDHLVAEFFQAVEGITGAFRELRSLLELPEVPVEALGIFDFADEYLSLLVERHCFDLLQLMRDFDRDRVPENWESIIGLVASEIHYRKSRQLPSVPEINGDNEQLIFRRNVLKKYMGNVLFLDTETRNEGRVLEQTLFGIAAGISMLFATAVLFLSQWAYGPLTLPVFLALVVGYMFKDRIKELLRVYFSRKLSGALFDRKMRLYTNSKKAVGHCRESFDFVDEARLPERLMKIRNRSHITEIESDWVTENVVRYNKRIKLSPKVISNIFDDYEVDGITDILRLNIAKFVQQTGEPSKELFVLDENDYQKIKAERVYHLNLILTYKCSARTRRKRFRIVFNRRKIKRIETVLVENF